MTDQMGPELPGMVCLKFLGAGGFADVYLYERDQPRIKVAVKVMKSAGLSEAQRRQFEAEADTMALLAEHPFIVPVLGAGTSPEGRPFLVMTYYPSADLAVRVAQNPLSVAEALRYGIQLASAVETAHRSGIIHRDIKPSNILMSSYGVMGLSDFGIAGRPTDMSHEEEIGISLPWSPREVVVGDSNGSVQSDVYSLAATVWHLLVGRAPFNVPGGDNSERATVTRIVHEKPPSIGRPEAPASLDRVLQQAMAKDPAYRPQTALELAQHFQRIEQELRLARTEIVVLEHGHVTEPSPVASTASLDATDVWSKERGATAVPPVVDMNATELKPPTRVVAQSPIPTSAAAPTGTRPAAASSGASPSAFAPTRKPSVFDKATDLRPARVDPDAAVEPEQESSSGSRWKLFLAAAVLLAAAVGGAIALTSGGGGGAKDPTVSRPPSDTHLPGTQTVLTKPAGLHKVSVTAQGVTFAWAAVPGATAYVWSYAGEPATHAVTRPQAVVPPKGGSTCITIKYVKAGQFSPTSDQACG